MKKLIVLICLGLIISITACFNMDINANTCIPLIDAPQDARNQIEVLSQRVVKAIEEDDEQSLIELASTQFLQNTEGLDEVLDQIYYSNVNYDEIEILGEYYLTFSKAGTNSIAMSVGNNTNPEYSFLITPISNEMVVTFSKLEQKAVTNILIQRYVKESGDWKLYGFSYGAYAINGMNAPDLYEKALELKERGDLASASLYAQALKSFLEPANIMIYPNSEAMNNFIDDTIEEANAEYQFPIMFETEKGMFEVFGITSNITEEGIGCVIQYISSIGIDEKNAVELKGEAKLIVDKARELLPGLEDNFDAYLVVAYEEIPVNENKQYLSFSTTIL